MRIVSHVAREREWMKEKRNGGVSRPQFRSSNGFHSTKLTISTRLFLQYSCRKREINIEHPRHIGVTLELPALFK
jgi:hypothetical protein